MTEHEPIEIHQAVNGLVGDESPLLGHACRGCSPPRLLELLADGESIETDHLVWWPCPRTTLN